MAERSFPFSNHLLRPVFILLILALAACASPPATTLPPPPDRIAVAPSLEALVTGWVSAYAEEHGTPGFDLEALPEAAGLEAAQAGEVSLFLSVSDPPAGWFAAPAAAEAIAVIVHPSNSVHSYSLHDLAALFTGRTASWEDLGGPQIAVQPVIPFAGDGLRVRFEAMVQEGSPSSPSALLAPSPSAVINLVSEDSGAIGYVPLSQIKDTVRAVAVDGVIPSHESVASSRYPLGLTVIATAPSEPSGAVRDWLAWVQSMGLTEQNESG